MPEIYFTPKKEINLLLRVEFDIFNDMNFLNFMNIKKTSICNRIEFIIRSYYVKITLINYACHITRYVVRYLAEIKFI